MTKIALLGAGGKMGVITHSLPFEMMMIGGAAVGSYLLSNDSAVLKHTVSGIIRAFKGPRWHESDNTQVLCLLFQLLVAVTLRRPGNEPMQDQMAEFVRQVETASITVVLVG